MTWNAMYKLNICHHALTKPRWALQPQGTQWFLRIGLFMVQAISLGPCRTPIEVLTSSHPCGRLSKIPNSQIHKVKKWKILSNFRRKDFFVISHERKDRFFVVIWPKKTLRLIPSAAYLLSRFHQTVVVINPSVGSGLKNFIFRPYGFDYLGFLTNARRGAMRSKTQWVIYRDLDWWPGPQKV